MNLTIKELEEKINMVENDILDMRSRGTNINQIVVLESYKEYLLDELAQATLNESNS
jgi:hypothetical protein